MRGISEKPLVGLKSIGSWCGNVSEDTVSRWIRTEGFPAWKRGGQYVTTPRLIQKWAENPTAGQR